MKTIKAIILSFVCAFCIANIALANIGGATLSVGGKVVAQQASISLSDAKLSLQLDGTLQRIDMQIISAGQVKNQASYQHLTAFNANASNMAKVMAKPGDQLKVKITFADGSVQEFTLELS